MYHVNKRMPSLEFKVHIKVGIAKFQPETRGLGSYLVYVVEIFKIQLLQELMIKLYFSQNFSIKVKKIIPKESTLFLFFVTELFW